MASTISFVGERLADAESITNWGLTQQDGGGGGWGSATLNADKVAQGSNAISYNASNSNNQFWYLWFDVTTSRGTSLDFSSGGANEGEVLYIWTFPQFPIQSTGNYAGEAGLGVMLGSNGTAAANTAQWTFYGFENLPGGFVRLALDPRKVPSASGASFNLSDVDYVGVCMSITSTRNGVAAVYMDAIDVGSGLLYTGSGVGDGFQELVDYDQNTLNNRYGICEPLESTETVLGLRGSIFVGQDGSDTQFVSNSKVIAFDPPKYYDNTGAYVNSVDSDFYGINLRSGGGAGSTNIRMGTSVSSDDNLTGRDGITFLANSDYNYRFTTESGIDGLNLYGCTIKNFSTPINLSGALTAAVDSDIAGCFFDNNGQVKITQESFIRNCSFLNASGDSALLWDSGQDIKNCSFISNVNSATNNGAGIEHPESLVVIYDNLTFSANDFDIYFSPASSGNLTINATNGSNPGSTDSDIRRGNANSFVDVVNTVTLTLEGIVADSDPNESSEVRIFETGTTTELDGVEGVVPTGNGLGKFDYAFQAGDPNVDIRIFNVNYRPADLLNFSLPGTNTSIPIQQIFDRNYDNP